MHLTAVLRAVRQCVFAHQQSLDPPTCTWPHGKSIRCHSASHKPPTIGQPTPFSVSNPRNPKYCGPLLSLPRSIIRRSDDTCILLLTALATCISDVSNDSYSSNAPMNPVGATIQSCPPPPTSTTFHQQLWATWADCFSPSPGLCGYLSSAQPRLKM